MPVAVATPVVVPPGGGGARAAAAVERPQTPRERLPEAPSTYPGINTLAEAELQQLQDSTLLLDDWITDHAAVLKISERTQELRKENAGLSRELLAKEASFAEIIQAQKSRHATLAEKRAKVESLAKRREELLRQHAPESQAAELLARAQRADGEADDLLSEALDGGTMDNSALASFKQRFMQQKAEKHWRTALKESLA